MNRQFCSKYEKAKDVTTQNTYVRQKFYCQIQNQHPQISKE